MAGTTQSQFQQSIEQAVGGKATDDGADISSEVLGDVTTTEVETEVEVSEDEVADEGEVHTEEEPVYRKGQVESIVKTRVGTLQKKIEKLSGFKAAVDKLCEVTGLDFETLSARLSGMSDVEQAKILGKTPEQVRAARETQAELAKERGKTQTMARQIEEQQLKMDPKFKDFDLFKEEIDATLEENPRLTMKQAYLLVKGDSALAAASRDGEQRAMAKVVNAQKKGVVKPVGASGAPAVKIDPATISAAKAVGMDPAEYSRYQNIDNLDAYRASKKGK